jgi:hypothetical protein
MAMPGILRASGLLPWPVVVVGMLTGLEDLAPVQMVLLVQWEFMLVPVILSLAASAAVLAAVLLGMAVDRRLLRILVPVAVEVLALLGLAMQVDQDIAELLGGNKNMFALIKNGFVENVIIADQTFADFIAHDWDAVVPANGMAIGWSYADGVGTAPQEKPRALVRDITPIAYLKRFTQPERIAIRAAATVNLSVNDYVQLLNAVTEVVHLDDPDTVAGLNALEAAGLIGVGRSAAIRA